METPSIYAYATTWSNGSKQSLSLGYASASNENEARGRAVTVGEKNNPGMAMTNHSVIELKLPFLEEVQEGLKKASDALDELCVLVGLNPETTDLETAMKEIKARLVV